MGCVIVPHMVRVYAVSIATADTDSDGLSILSMNEDQKAVRVYAVGMCTFSCSKFVLFFGGNIQKVWRKVGGSL